MTITNKAYLFFSFTKTNFFAKILGILLELYDILIF